MWLFTLSPSGCDRLSRSRTDPSGFSRAPSELHLNGENGGAGKGPIVCPRATSFEMAADTASGRFRAERLFGLCVEVLGPEKPMSAPCSRRLSTGVNMDRWTAVS